MILHSSNYLSKNLLQITFGIIIYFVAFTIFFFIIYNHVISDIQEHTELLIAKINVGSFLVPPLYYSLLYLFSGFSTSAFVLNYTAVFLLAMAVTLKFYVSYGVLKNISQESKNDVMSFLFCASFLFLVPIFFPIEDRRMLLGRIGLTIWHNSTSIFVLPFAVWLFKESLFFMKEEKWRWKQVATIFFLGLLNILIKPSFIFVFLPAFFILNIVYFQTKQKLALIVLIILLFGVLLLAEYYIIYEMNLAVKQPANQDGIGFGFFDVWKRFSNNIFREIMISIAFPILFISLYYQKIKSDIYFQYSILIFVFAFLIAVCVHETGARMYHGNFFWQLILANYVLFLVIGSFLWREIRASDSLRAMMKSPKLLAVTLCYLAHLGSGFLYIFKIFYTGAYT